MKKKLVSLLLTATMVASLAACGGGDSTAETPAADSSSETTTAEAPAENTDASAGDAAAEAPAETGSYQLDTLNVVVNGTVTATVDNGQADFEKQWEEAVSEKLGHPFDQVVLP